MKTRIFIIVAAIAAAIASCGKENPVNGSAYPQFDKPEMLESAALYSFEENIAGYRSLELTEGGVYLIHAEAGTRSEEATEPVFYAGPYTKSGNSYALEGFGKANIVRDNNETLVFLTKTGEGSIELAASVKKAGEPAGLTAAICRDWKVERVTASVDGLGKTFTGCDLGEIYAWYKDSGLNVAKIEKAIPGIAEGHDVTGVCFSANGTVAVTFSGAQPYVGSWNWADEGQGLATYDFSISGKGDTIINQKGAASVTVNENGLGVLLETEYGKHHVVINVTLAEK